MVHDQIRQSFPDHQLLPIFTQMASGSTIRMTNRASKLSRPHSKLTTTQTGLEIPKSAHAATTTDKSANEWHPFAFEQELFRSAVYSRTAHRTASLCTTTTTITAHTCSILSHLTLADVSVVSVLRLPIKVEALTNASLYIPQHGASMDPAEPLETQESCVEDPVPARAAAIAAAIQKGIDELDDKSAAAARKCKDEPGNKSAAVPTILPLKLGERKYRTRALPPVPLPGTQKSAL